MYADDESTADLCAPCEDDGTIALVHMVLVRNGEADLPLCMEHTIEWLTHPDVEPVTLAPLLP